MIITPIGQSGYVIRTARTEIIIDPYLSDVVNEIAGRPRMLPIPINPQEICADAVICTHNHLDHLDVGAIPFMREEQFFVTTNEGKAKLAELNRYNTKSLKTGESIMVGDVEITAVYANHTVEAFGVILKGEGYTLYFSGDTLYDERLFEISEYKPDITFICINGKLGNMNVQEALVTAEKIGASINIPSHYDMFSSNSENPELFAMHIQGGRVLEFNKNYKIDEWLAK